MFERKLLYAFRGWIAFVAFMDMGTAVRSYIERRSFLGDHSQNQFIAGKKIMIPIYYACTYIPCFHKIMDYTDFIFLKN